MCVNGLCVRVVCERAGRRSRSGRQCTTKNKNPTQRCGEKLPSEAFAPFALFGSGSLEIGSRRGGIKEDSSGVNWHH